MATILVTGANRGLGLGLVEKLLKHKNPPALLLATCRDPNTASELVQLKQEYSNLRILQLDVNDASTFSLFADKISTLVGDSGLNILINMAGIHKHKDTLADVTIEDYLDTYQTNVIGPVFLTKALLPLLQISADTISKNNGKQMTAILNISSLLGSVAFNITGGHYSYRESKAAINTFSRNLALELREKGIMVLPVHPGWVQTDLGGPNAPLTIEQSVTGLCDIVYNLNESQNGQFLQWDETTLPW